MTTVMSSPLAGAEMMTFRAPAARWPLAFSASVNRPCVYRARKTRRPMRPKPLIAMRVLISFSRGLRAVQSGLEHYMTGRRRPSQLWRDCSPACWDFYGLKSGLLITDYQEYYSHD